MTVWEVGQQDGPAVYFIGGCCAVSFYNEDRARRTPPAEVEPTDGALLIDCAHGAAK